MSGRSVLVVGGSRGIGLEVARQMTEEGDRVAVTYRSGEPPFGLFGAGAVIPVDGGVAMGH